jgi:hypothetical protein
MSRAKGKWLALFILFAMWSAPVWADSDYALKATRTHARHNHASITTLLESKNLYLKTRQAEIFSDEPLLELAEKDTFDRLAETLCLVFTIAIKVLIVPVTISVCIIVLFFISLIGVASVSQL